MLLEVLISVQDLRKLPAKRRRFFCGGDPDNWPFHAEVAVYHAIAQPCYLSPLNLWPADFQVWGQPGRRLADDYELLEDSAAHKFVLRERREVVIPDELRDVITRFDYIGEV